MHDVGHSFLIDTKLSLHPWLLCGSCQDLLRTFESPVEVFKITWSDETKPTLCPSCPFLQKTIAPRSDLWSSGSPRRTLQHQFGASFVPKRGGYCLYVESNFDHRYRSRGMLHLTSISCLTTASFPGIHQCHTHHLSQYFTY